MADNGWRETTVGVLCDEGGLHTQTGPFGSQLHSCDYVPSGVSVVPTEGIGRRRLLTEGIPEVAEETAVRLSRHRLKAGDIWFARRGVQATGLSAIVTPRQEGWLCGTGAILLRVKGKAVDPEFLSFLLSAEESVLWLKQHAVGAVMPNLNEGVIRQIPLTLPPLAEQKVIAAVLGALDDKIELNRRMNATLEAMARALFQSWCIDFDPVRRNMDRNQPSPQPSPSGRGSQHGNLPSPAGRRAGDEGFVAYDKLFPEHLEDSPLGHIPKGWTAQRLPDAIEVTPRRTLKSGTIAPYLDMKNLPTQGHSAEEVIDREFSSGTKFQNGDTLLARITPCLENGKTGYVDFLEDGQVGSGSTEYIVLAPKPPLPPQFGYLLARSDALRTHAIQNMTGTSGRQRVPSECFNTFWLAVPPPDIARRFDELTAPLMAKIKANSTQSRTLATLRDTLLPKLLSGELRLPIEELEVAV